MAAIVRFNGNVIPFSLNSATADRKVFAQVPSVNSDTLDDNLNADYIIGFRAVVPTTSDFVEIQHFQAVNYTNTALTTYLYQKGIPEWNTEQEMYHPCVILGTDGTVYKSESGFDFTQNPVGDDGTNWSDLSSLSEATEFIATGTADAIILTGISGYGSISSYQINQVIRFKVITQNTGSVTIKADDAGVVSINDAIDSALVGGEFKVGDWVEAVSLNGSTFRVISNIATTASINKPTIVSPSNGDVGESTSLTITSSAFATYLLDGDTHASTDWQVASDSGFTAIVFQSLADSTNRTSIAVPSGNLSFGIEYFIRVRYNGASLPTSDYSTTVSFTTVTYLLPLFPILNTFARDGDNVVSLMGYSPNDEVLSLNPSGVAGNRGIYPQDKDTGVSGSFLNDSTFSNSTGITGDVAGAVYFLKKRIDGFMKVYTGLNVTLDYDQTLTDGDGQCCFDNVGDKLIVAKNDGSNINIYDGIASTSVESSLDITSLGIGNLLDITHDGVNLTILGTVSAVDRLITLDGVSLTVLQSLDVSSLTSSSGVSWVGQEFFVGGSSGNDITELTVG